MTSDISTEAKRRWRWPRFKLSTILVLVAVAAWAMAYWPYYEKMDPIVAMINDATTPHVPPHQPWSGYWGLDEHLWFWKVKLTVEKLLLPELALVVFLTWKGAWTLEARLAQRMERSGRWTRYQQVIDRVRLIATGFAIAAVLVCSIVYFVEHVLRLEFR